MYKPSIRYYYIDSISKVDVTVLNQMTSTVSPNKDCLITVGNITYEIVEINCNYDNNRIDVLVRIKI